jgi:hypothetical protein
MTTLPSAFFLIALAFVPASCGPSHGKQVEMSPSTAQQVLSLNRSNDGQTVATTVGQSIEITLQTIGPGQYGDPHISHLQSGLRVPRFQRTYRTQAARSRYIVSARLPKEKPRSKFLTQLQTPLLR